MDEGAWRDFVTRQGERARYDRFADFVTTPPLKGLGSDVAVVRRIVAANEEAPDLLDRALQRPEGGSSKIALTDDIVHSENDQGRPAGNSESAALRRLRRTAPELHADVLAGRLSAHAAMVQAGYRPKTISVPVARPDAVARSLLKHMSPDDIARLITALTSGTGLSAH